MTWQRDIPHQTTKWWIFIMTNSIKITQRDLWQRPFVTRKVPDVKKYKNKLEKFHISRKALCTPSSTLQNLGPALAQATQAQMFL